MTRENIRFQEGNFTSDGTYFYSMLDSAQVLQQKVDDGTVSFSYPLDTAIAGDINGLEWDGVYFWSLEDRDGADGVTVRKWGVESFICKQQQKFEFVNDATHTYTCQGLALEHYRLTVGDNVNGDDYTFNQTSVSISDTSMLIPGDILTFVRRYTSAAQRVGTIFVEQVVVNSISSTTVVELQSAMVGNPHSSSGASPAVDPRGFRGPSVDPDDVEVTLGTPQPPTPDEVFVTKFIWLSNANSPGEVGTPSLYKARASNGTNVLQFSGTQYNNVNALTFYAKYNVSVGNDNPPAVSPMVGGQTVYNTSVVVDSGQGGRQTYLLIARDSSLLFFNTDTASIDRSMVLNNIKVDTINHWNVDDMVVVGVEPNIIIYRLQTGTTYKNESLVLTDASWGQFNYEKQLLRRVVSSISVNVFPSIIPADAGLTDAVATATLRDQYNDVAAGVAVTWSDDAGGGKLIPQGTLTDSFGQIRAKYNSGSTEQDVKVIASVVSGLIDP